MTNQIIIADSSPLIALAIIEQLELLPQLYHRVLVPNAVWNEITVSGKGMPGASQIACLEWLEIHDPAPEIVAPLSILVDRGEAAAIALAQSVSEQSIVLLDDAQARRVAERLSVNRIGTLGILRKAKKAGLLSEIKPMINCLQQNGIYIRQQLIDAIVRDVGE